MEEGPDRWTPPVCDSRAWDPLVIGRREGRGAGAGMRASWAAAYCAHYAGNKKGAGQGKKNGEGKDLGLRTDFQGEGGRENKYLSNFIFKSLLN